MTGTMPIYVSRKDTSSRSIYRPHCQRGIEFDDDDDINDQDDDIGFLLLIADTAMNIGIELSAPDTKASIAASSKPREYSTSTEQNILKDSAP